MSADILTVSALHAALTIALAQGLSPDTAVVIGDHNHTWFETSAEIGDPTTDDGNEWIWFTLFTAADADPLSTPEHAYYCNYCHTYGHLAAECGEREIES